MKQEKQKNKMRSIRIAKITLSIGAGTEQEDVEKAVFLLERISGAKPVKTLCTKRIAEWKLRPGLPVGAMVTIRGKKAEELLKRLLMAVDNQLKKESFAKNGFAFGIKEYIDIPEIKYDTKIGIIGLDVSVTLERAGFRVKRKKIKSGKIQAHHEVSAEEGWNFIVHKFGVKEKED